MATRGVPCMQAADTSSVSIETEHVTSVYDSIAPHFSLTRYKPWPRVESFLLSLPTNSLVADIGCGNGKYLHLHSSGVMIGCDTSVKLLALAKHNTSHLLQADTTNIPLRSNIFDAIISIAVIHHLSSEERRVAALREMARVLVPGGRMLVYVWAMEQGKREFSSQDVLVPWRTRKVQSAEETGKKIKRKRGVKKLKLKNTDVKTGPVVHEVELDCLFEDNAIEEYGNTTDSVSTLNTEIEPVDTDKNIEVSEEVYRNSTGETDKYKQISSRDTFDTFMRYYHVFRENELRQLVERNISNAKVLDCYYDHENWCVIVMKSMNT